MSYFGSIVQNVLIPAGNDSTDNLAAGATFTGDAASTLGVAGIQVTLKTDQNCTVYVEQSPDGTNWDNSDPFKYYTAIDNFSQTVQAVSSYTRVRVTNTGLATTTYLRLQMALCPIVEAIPRACTSDGFFKTSVQEIINEQNDSVLISPYRELQVEEPTKLVGSAFFGTTLDPNFWTATVTNSGSIAESGGLVNLRTNTAGNGTARLDSVLVNRYVPGHSMRFRTQFIQDVGTADNTRTWGTHDGTDGMYFKLNGATFCVETKNTNSITTVSSGSFNGDYGNTYAMDASNHGYDIIATNGRASFYVDNVLLHKVSASTSRIVGNLNIPIRITNENSGGSVTDVQMKCLVASIARLGKQLSQPRYKYQTGTTAGNICKYGAGNLHSIVIGGVTSGSVITLYDSTTAGGAIIYSTTLNIGTQAFNMPVSVDFKGLPFNNGLTLVIATQNSNVTLIYE